MTTTDDRSARRHLPGLRPQDLGIGVLFWSIRDAAIVGDAASGRVVLWSPSAEALFGYSAEEIVGHPIEVLVPDALKGRHRAGLARYATTGHGALIDAGGPVELPARCKDGADITIELTLAPIEGITVPGRFVLAVIRDATDRKRVEAEQLRLVREQAARAEAEAGQRRLAFLAEASAALAASLDYEVTLSTVARLAVPFLADWCIVDVVDEGGALHRVEVVPADPEQEPLAAILCAAPPAADRSVGIAQVLRTGEPELLPRVTAAFVCGVARDAAHLRALEQVGFRSYMGVPLVARGQTLGGISFIAAGSRRHYGHEDLALAADLAQRAALAVDNARLYREAQEAIRARDRFLSIAAHELRTPITVVKGMAELLLRPPRGKGADPEHRARLLGRLAESATRLARLTDDLLDVSRLRLGRLPLRLAPLDLGELARTVAARYADRLEGRGAPTVTGVEGCVVVADRDRIEQVLTNLLDNAVKYSPHGGGVEVAVAPEGDGVCVTVRDAGIGLPAGAEETIFEPFGRAANATALHLPGLGLGLYLSRELVERHGGWIRAESAGEGQGTTVTFWLPSDEGRPGLPSDDPTSLPWEP
ncbi:MAG: ATP-binding protein [Chloroflexota bacterium]|nr:ATP-binding protein [Chloroflexota bacterium]